jgi:hypothetical protein
VRWTRRTPRWKAGLRRIYQGRRGSGRASRKRRGGFGKRAHLGDDQVLRRRRCQSAKDPHRRGARPLTSALRTIDHSRRYIGAMAGYSARPRNDASSIRRCSVMRVVGCSPAPQPGGCATHAKSGGAGTPQAGRNGLVIAYEAPTAALQQLALVEWLGWLDATFLQQHATGRRRLQRYHCDCTCSCSRLPRHAIAWLFIAY